MLRAATCLLAAMLVAGPVSAQSRVGEMILKNLVGGNRNYWVPSGSMRPGLWPGDVLSARPVSRGGPIERGDVIFFKENGVDYLKRVIAIGGDRIKMSGGVPVLNGTPLRQEPLPDLVFPFQVENGPAPRCANAPVAIGEDCVMPARMEFLPSGRSYVVLDTFQSHFDETTEFVVPEGALFVMGDNRDNSLDSRAAPATGGRGMVPVENVRHRGGFIFRFASDGPSERSSDF